MSAHIIRLLGSFNQCCVSMQAEKERQVKVGALAASLKESKEKESKLGALQAEYNKMVAQNKRYFK